MYVKKNNKYYLLWSWDYDYLPSQWFRWTYFHATHRRMLRRICFYTLLIAHSPIMFSSTFYLDHTFLVHLSPPPFLLTFLYVSWKRKPILFIIWLVSSRLFSPLLRISLIFSEPADFYSNLPWFCNILLWLYSVSFHYAVSFSWSLWC